MLAIVVLGSTAARGGEDVEPEAVRPGLLATYRSLGATDATLHRIDSKPSFYLGRSSPHPRLPSGPFEVAWDGLILLRERGPIRFLAEVGGELEIELDGKVVLRGRGTTSTGRLDPADSPERPPGYYRLKIRYRSLADVPARLQLLWEGVGFAREPLPAWRLGHLPAEVSPAARADEKAERGRAAVVRHGCARCHASAFPGVVEPPPGPSLADAGSRLRRDWLLRWLEEPAAIRPEARMPGVFSSDRRGFVERWILADSLSREDEKPTESRPSRGDHRAGRRDFLGLGCAACHLVPDVDRGAVDDPGRVALSGLTDRMGAESLAAFLANPHARYPDGRMPRLPIAPEQARDIAAYLLLWSKTGPVPPAPAPPTADEVRDVGRRLGATGQAVAAALARDKGCTSCHPGLGPSAPQDVPIKAAAGGCLSQHPSLAPRHQLDESTREALAAFLAVSPREIHPSSFADGQRQLERSGCVRCHQRDSDRPPPIEAIGARLGGAFLETLPYQRTPRLTDPLRKLQRPYLSAIIREGSVAPRYPGYSYRMPAFGTEAERLVRALSEADGELPEDELPPAPPAEDPTTGTLNGPALVGSQGYGCISCHAWGGRQFSQPDPGAMGPDLTRIARRVRRDWFDRFLEGPERFYPGTPMPAVFRRGQPATLGTVLGGDPARQKAALWSYLVAGTQAPAPKPPPPVPITSPSPGDPPLVAQIPIRRPGGEVVESICMLDDRDDLLIYDLAAGAPQGVLTRAQILRDVESRLRRFHASGTPISDRPAVESPVRLILPGRPASEASREFLGYDRLADGVRLRWRLRFDPQLAVELEETLRIERDADGRRFSRSLRATGVPAAGTLWLNAPSLGVGPVRIVASLGKADLSSSRDGLTARLSPDASGIVAATIRAELPAARKAPAWEGKPVIDPGRVEGSLVRPGYRAIAYPRPKTVTGEDRIMPGALAVHPKDGRVFVSSLKTGELHVLLDASGDGRSARFEDYTRGLFQDAFGMLAEDDALYVLHRRNLTRIVDTDRDGRADRFDRIVSLPHGVADTYDYAYGLVRDTTGAFIVSYAPHANRKLVGSGGVLRLTPGQPPRELAFGLRNPLGWSVGPGGEVFFTDNQGEWVAANKLCHLEEGRFYGYPNAEQAGHASRPRGKAAVWIPYGWARSINGVAYDATGGRFGPFAGQFFLAELMFGGAIIRADVERVNGQYQGACFPFWGQGLLGPVVLAFGPQGRLYVGGITEPGWMAQPDRGALFGIDYTGPVPFEMQTIRVRPRGFRIAFTAPVDSRAAADPGAYRLEHYRYEYTGAYGSPELDRTPVPIERVTVSSDRLSVDLTTARLVKDRVYVLDGVGVRSASGQPLVQPIGAYTLNEIPAGAD